MILWIKEEMRGLTEPKCLLSHLVSTFSFHGCILAYKEHTNNCFLLLVNLFVFSLLIFNAQAWHISCPCDLPPPAASGCTDFPQNSMIKRQKLRCIKSLEKNKYFQVYWKTSEIYGGDKFLAQVSGIQMDFQMALSKPGATF